MADRVYTKEAKQAARLQRENERFDELTLHKVYFALRRSGLNEIQTANALDEMQNAGILFRELKET